MVPIPGLVSLSYKLYKEPVLGDWKILAVVNGKETEQEFKIQHYGKNFYIMNILSTEIKEAAYWFVGYIWIFGKTQGRPLLNKGHFSSRTTFFIVNLRVLFSFFKLTTVCDRDIST